MTPRLLRAGDRAVLVHTDDLATTLAVAAQLRRADLAGVEDLIPAAETVLVRLSARRRCRRDRRSGFGPGRRC